MGSKFENFDLGRRVAEFLGLKDVKNFPVKMNTDELQPVLSLPGPGSPLNFVSTEVEAFDVTGIGVQTMYPLLNGTGSNVGAVPNPNFDYLLGDLWISLGFNAAGAIAFNAKYIGINLFTLTVGGNNHYCYSDTQAIRVITGKTGYEWTMRFNQGASRVTADTHRGSPCLRPLFMSRGRAIGFQIYAEDGTVFPALTTVTFRGDLYHDRGWGKLRP